MVPRLRPTLAELLIGVLGIAVGLPSHALAQVPHAQCQLVPLQGSDPPIPRDLAGRYEFVVTETSAPSVQTESFVLVLSRIGDVLEEVPISSGDRIQVALRDNVVVQNLDTPAITWRINAPGVLVRTRAFDGLRFSYSYCSPYAAIRVDQPDDPVFSATTRDPRASVYLTIGIAQMKPETIRIEVDCVDIVSALGIALPGGPFSGVVSLGEFSATVDNLVADFDQGTIDLRLRDLPGGSHTVVVRGEPVYADELPSPPGHEWPRPVGALEHSRTLSVFRVRIDEPDPSVVLPAGTRTVVRGEATHGLPITNIRVNGQQATLSDSQIQAAGPCRGPVHQVSFATELSATDMLDETETGNNNVAALDPGQNVIYAIAADGVHSCNDGVPVVVGQVKHYDVSADGAPGRPSETCEQHVVPSDDRYVQDGFIAAFSSRIFGEVAQQRLLPSFRDRLVSEFDALIDREFSTCISPCLLVGDVDCQMPDDPGDPDILCPHQGLGGRAEATAGGVDGSMIDAAARPSGHDHETCEPDSIPDHALRVRESLVIDLDWNPCASFRIDPPVDRAFILRKPGISGCQSDSIAFVFYPSCDQIGLVPVRILEQAFSGNMCHEFVISVGKPECWIRDWRIDSATLCPSEFEAGARLTAGSSGEPDSVQFEFDTGKTELHIDGLGTFWPDYRCFLGICCDVDIDDLVFLVDNVRLNATVGVDKLCRGILSGDDVVTSVPEGGVTNPRVELRSYHIEGSLGLCETFEFFSDMFDFLFGAGWLPDNIVLPGLESAVVGALQATFNGLDVPPMNLAGLGEVFSHDAADVGEGVPLVLSTEASNVFAVSGTDLGRGALGTGIHSLFDAAPADPTMPPTVAWNSTLSRIPTIKSLGNPDLGFMTSDDALNQMFGALTSTGEIEAVIDDRTIGELGLPEAFLAYLEFLGIEQTEPVVLNLTTRQEVARDDGSYGVAVPPFIALIDDPGTDGVEVFVRVQMMSPLLLPRGLSTDEVLRRHREGSICNGCSQFDPECRGAACDAGDYVLKLNLRGKCFLTTGHAEPAIEFLVTEVQQVNEAAEFPAFEPGDFSQPPEDFEPTANDDLLESLREAINRALPTLVVPNDILTLDGLVKPDLGTLHLTSVAIDSTAFHANLGVQDFVGLALNIVPQPGRVGVQEVVLAHTSAQRNSDSDLSTSRAAESIGEVEERGDTDSMRSGPNPGIGGTVIYFKVDTGQTYSVGVYDVRGRLVWRQDGFGQGTPVALAWDARAETGERVAAGTYFYRVSKGREVETGKVTIVQ